MEHPHRGHRERRRASSSVPPTTAAAAAETGDGITLDPTTNLVTFNPQPTDAAAYNNYLMVESYLVFPTSGLAAAKAIKLAQFIRYVLGPTGQSDIAVLGAAPATPAEVTAGLKVAAELDAEATATAASGSGRVGLRVAAARRPPPDRGRRRRRPAPDTDSSASAPAPTARPPRHSPSPAPTPSPWWCGGSALVALAAVGRWRLRRRMRT